MFAKRPEVEKLVGQISLGKFAVACSWRYRDDFLAPLGVITACNQTTFKRIQH
jgi:hypothetical protein